MANTPPELQQLLSESVNRTQYQNPLFQAVTQMAYQGLPTYARQGTSLGQMGPAAPIQQQQDGGGIPDWMKMLGAGLGGAALNSLGPQGNALKALIDGLKKLFAGKGKTGVGNDANLWPEMGPQSPIDPSMFGPPSFPQAPSPNVSTDEWPGAWPEPPAGSNGGPVSPDMFPQGGLYPPFPDPSEE